MPMPFRNPSFLFLIILFITLYFGLRVKDFDFINHVKPLSSGVGIEILKNGIAYSGPIEGFRDDLCGKLTIEIALRPLKEAYKGHFQTILLLHDGNDKTQLIVGQWKRWIIVMNGDDYSHSLKRPRVSLKIPNKISAGMLTIVSNRDGTKVFYNGRLISKNKRLHLKVPIFKPPFLVFGNNCYGSSPWNGRIYGFALFKRALSEKEILSHYKVWKKDHSFKNIKVENPFIIYTFDKIKDGSFNDLGLCGYSLKVPHTFKIIFKKIDLMNGIYKWNILDGLINFFGFIPLGFMSIFVFAKRPGFSILRAFLCGLFLCFGTSLFIEIIQMWIPSRCADLRDIILNTCGGIMGMSVFLILIKKSPVLFERVFSLKLDLEK